MGTNGDIRIKLATRVMMIPQALPETIKRMQELISMRDEMIRQLERERDRYNPDDVYASPECFYDKMFKVHQEYNDKYKKKLGEEIGSEYFYSPITDYMYKFDSICQSVSKRISSAYAQQVDSYMLGMKIAEREALKELKGMPYEIRTTSFSSALLFAGISVINEGIQAKRADETYNRIIAQYSSNNAVHLEMKIITEEIIPLIYLVSEKTTAAFLEDVLNKIDFCSDIGYKKLDKRHKTQMLIDDSNYIYGDTIALRKAMYDLQLISDNRLEYGKILDILEECPYCPELYLKIIKMGVFDKTVFEIAKIVNIEKKILPELEKEVVKRKSNINDIKPILEIIAVYKSQPLEKVLKSTYHGEISKIKSNYHELYLLVTDSKKLDKWIALKIDSNMDNVVTTSEEDVRSKVNSWIQRNVEDSEFAELSSVGLMTIEDIRMKDSMMTTLEDVKSEYMNKIVARIMDYIKEANVRKMAYEEAYDKFNAELEKKSNALNSKIVELKQQSIFAFSKKKEIKAEIEQLQREFEDYKCTEPVEVKKAYYKMYE